MYRFSLYNSQSEHNAHRSIAVSKGSSSLQSSYLSSYTTPSSMTQYSSYAGYNSGTATFPTIPQNISSASQVSNYFSLSCHVMMCKSISLWIFLLSRMCVLYYTHYYKVLGEKTFHCFYFLFNIFFFLLTF